MSASDFKLPHVKKRRDETYQSSSIKSNQNFSSPTENESAVIENDDEKKIVLSGVDLNELPDVLPPEKVKEILDAADYSDLSKSSNITRDNIKRVLNLFERRIRLNEEHRLKFSDDPEKFLKSEVDLDEEIQKLKPIGADPELLQTFIDTHGFQLLIPLLNHANIDLAGNVVSVLVELTGPDLIIDLSNPHGFIDVLDSSGCPSLLAELLCRVDEHNSEDDYQIVSNCLQVVENMLEVNPPVVADLFTTQATKFVPWLVKRIKYQQQSPTPTTAANSNLSVCYNKVFASELLSIILQNSLKCRVGFCLFLINVHFQQSLGNRNGLDGIDKLLRCIAYYRKMDPRDPEEEEYLENVGNCLVSLLEEAPNRLCFGKLQGIDLMIRLLKERVYAYSLGCKLLVYALQDCPENCNAFVEKLGLKSLFGIFMKRGVRHKPGSRLDKDENEHCTSIILHLCRHTKGTHAARVLNKFTENKCEKVERLLELHQHYLQRIKEGNARRKEQKEIKEIANELELDKLDQDYLDRCEDGLFIAQSVDNILIRLANMGSALLTQRIHWLLDIKGIPIQEIYDVITEYVSSLSPLHPEKKTIFAYLEHFVQPESE